jgi:hypothetical protein
VTGQRRACQRIRVAELRSLKGTTMTSTRLGIRYSSRSRLATDLVMRRRQSGTRLSLQPCSARRRRPEKKRCCARSLRRFCVCSNLFRRPTMRGSCSTLQVVRNRRSRPTTTRMCHSGSPREGGQACVWCGRQFSRRIRTDGRCPCYRMRAL